MLRSWFVALGVACGGELLAADAPDDLGGPIKIRLGLSPAALDVRDAEAAEDE